MRDIHKHPQAKTWFGGVLWGVANSVGHLGSYFRATLPPPGMGRR